jgi:flavin-dependent dehydrogenase
VNLQAPPHDVFIIGGGPAGLAAAIAARQNGLQATVADSLRPPIDKACGEGLMPDAVAALQALGVRFSASEAISFRGIRFLDGRTGLSTEALFPQGVGLAVRRTALHAKLAARAAETGAVIHWGARVTLLDRGKLLCDGREVQSGWVIGADGLQSQVRRWAGLQPSRREGVRAVPVYPEPRRAARCRKRERFGFRRHFGVAPWSDFVEVYWGSSCQIAVTPIAPDEVGLAMISRDPAMRVQEALREMPVLAAHLADAQPTTGERGAPCALRRLPALCRGRVALIGDASGSVDPVTGEGLGLAFRQALSLGAALRHGDLRRYQRAHERIGRMPHRMSRLILCMDRSAWLRQRALRALAAEPHLFARLLGAHVDGRASSPLGAVDALRLGWRLARS